MDDYVCKICGNNKNNKLYIAKEMMLGTHDEFEYYECSKCGCVQIKDFPENLQKYYPDDYYSYSNMDNYLKVTIKDILLKIYFHLKLGIGENICQYIPTPHNFYPWLQKDFISFNSKILDIGCGAGKQLIQMKKIGFNHLMGIDPFIPNDVHYNCGISVYKKYIHELNPDNNKFDFIMLHHSFEHMDNPLSTLKCIHNLLNKNRYVLIRIPVANSFAWRKYNVNWVQLDVPRHFFLHTTQSIQSLCEQTGFKLKKILFDSCWFQFIGSEMYLRNMSLYEDASLFNKKDIKRFEKISQRLNDMQDGDSACFFLLKE